MKTVVLATVILGIASIAHADGWDYSNGPVVKTLDSCKVWSNNSAVKIKTTKTGYYINGKVFTVDVGPGSYFDFVEGNIENPTNSYEVMVDATGNLISPALAKWTGGSPTFVRTCK